MYSLSKLVAVFGFWLLLSLPAFSLGRTIALGEFLERIEIIPMGAWTLSAGIKLACFLWAGAVGLAQWCGLQRYQPLVYPLSVLALSLGILYFNNITEIDVFADIEHVGMWVILLVTGSLLILSMAQIWRVHRAKADGR